MKLPRCLALLALCLPLALPAQNTVFSDSFTGDSLNPASYPAVTATTTGWTVLSNKNIPAPVETGGVLTINMAGTTSGFVETQALFAPAPVQLLPGTYLELTATFTPTFILTNPSDNLIFGLFNSGGTAPLTGLMNSGLSSALTTFANGGAKGWIGYNANIPLTGASPKMLTRPAQTGTTNTVQDVVVDSQSTSVGYSVPAGKSASNITALSTTLTNGSTYTLDYKLSLSADGLTLTAAVALYNGTGTTGTGANTLIGANTGKFTGTNLLTQSFDALALGWRADAGGANPSNLKLSALTVRTTGGTPWFITQPPSDIAVSIGSDLNLVTEVGGAVASDQWQVSTDGGGTFTNIDSAANPSAATAELTLTNVQYSAAGIYRLVATNAAGSTTSANCNVTVSTTPVAPTISTNPTDATVLGGTSHTFKVTVNGTSPLTYQWEQSPDSVAFNPIAGATAATYTISPVSLSDAGFYRVTVTNVAGSATSGAAQLVVNQPLTFTVQPVGAALNLGASYTLSATAVGNPAPTYQWYLNGAALSGATNSTYTIASAAAASAGTYTVIASNASGDSVTSSGAAVAVLSSTLAPTALTPAATPAGVAPDARLSLTFNQPVSVGTTGTIKIYDAANPTTPVDTIDLVAGTALMKTLRAANAVSTLALPVQTKTIGGASGFNYYPITITGNTATIYPRNNVLTYGKTYFVTIDPGVFTDSTGLSYAGISGNSGWTFTTRTASPSGSATQLVVAADGSGDFYTVQGALDFIPAGNTTPRTISLRRGTYFEEVYFTGKHAIALLGEDVDQTAVVYPNNAVFNNAGGIYHRGTLYANSVHDLTIANLTVNNTTPQNGAQAEAIIVSGTSPTTAHNLITRCKFYSYQDTVQFNNQIYVSDSTILGDVDFLWGGGPAFFENCDIRILRSGAYFTQIRNGNGNHGYVFVGCRFTAPAGITGTFLGRIDPAGFPYSEVVVLDSTFGDATNNAFLATTTGVSGSNYLGAWWLLNNAASAAAAPNVHNWSNSLVNATGASLVNPNTDAFTTMPADATLQANYRNATWVLNTNLAGTVNGSWTPSLAPVIVVPPASQIVNIGDPVTLAVTAFAIPAPTYQWRKNGADIPGATSAAYAIASVTAADADTYTVVVANSAGSVTSSAATLLVNGGPPVITQQPVSQSAFAGTNLSLSVFAVGNGPFNYQWFKAGSPISGATGPSLLLTGVQAADAADYTVTVGNANGSATSHAATLTIATPASATTPTLPTIPTAVFNVTSYGAVGDGVTDNTAAIAATIAAAKSAGGGIIELPPAAGAYLSGPIVISSNMNLQVDGGATLKMLPYGTYPSLTTHFITVEKRASNIAITGNGTIDGDGAAWWTAYDSGVISTRPRLVQFTEETNVLVTGVTLRNSPSFNLAFSGNNTNLTIFGVSIIAPGDSPNTDGMDLAGTNILVQNCYVSVGDDNVVAKPGSAFCRNLVVADCSFGTGHGVSIGGQTNVGLDGMLVTNCTFDGTSSALRFKADPTQGGPVQNVTFSHLTMKNVLYPILFYSYYNVLGSPGATSGSSQITPAKANAYNVNPPNSLALPTIPTWKNILVTDLTVINGAGYSTIWGLPTADALIQNVTLNNVTIQGGAGLELYNAANIQLTGITSVGPIITCNALAITGQPAGQTINVGDSVTFTATAVGGSGTNNTGLTYRWNLDGMPLTDGAQADGSTISGATTATLTITNARVSGAGNYTLTASTTLDGYNTSTNALVANSLAVSATSSAALLTVNPLAATIAVSDATFTYDGSAKVAIATTSPANIAVQLTYNGDANAPVNAGSYTVVATFADANYTGPTATATLTIQPAVATVTLSDLTPTFTGAPLAATVTTTPPGVAVALTYDGNATPPTNVGSYAVAATVTDPNYTGSATGTLVVAKATAAIALGNTAQTYDGTPKPVTASTAPAGLAVDLTYDGSTTAPTKAGSYAVVATINEANYTGSATGTLVIAKATAALTLSGLAQTYDGTPKPVTVTTTPADLTVDVTYDGSATAPTAPGSYAVVATVKEPNYAGTASGTLVISTGALVRHAPSLNGGIDGSLQVLLPESTTFNGSAYMSGDLLVPGTPTVRLNGRPTYAGTLDGTGVATPSDYTITLNGGAVLRHVVRRTDAVTMPTVSAPPAPTGTRDVELTKAGQSIGDLATLRNLTINDQAGSVAVPAGTYGTFTADGKANFVFGVAGATTPSVYNLQGLKMNGSSQLQIVGPVIIVLAHGATLDGNVVSTGNPAWLTLMVASGDVTLNGNVTVSGLIVAPSGTVTVNGHSTLVGGVIADRLTINGNGLLDTLP